MTPPIAHAELIASYRKVAAEAALISAAGKGPQTIAAVTETANKAARRRDVLASKLAKLGIALAE